LDKRIDCRVVRATYQPEEDMPAAEVTFWIEKERGIVRKQSVVAHYSISTLQPLRELVVNEITS